MIRPNSKQLRVGWLIPTVGTFGAVREMIEVSNVLVSLGHQVYIYHPDGSQCRWLRCLATCRRLEHLALEPLDVLIGIVDWQPELYQNLLDAPAKIKAICLLGFEPTEQMARALRGEEPPADKAQKIISDAMRRKFLVLADSSWQIEWLRKNTAYLPSGPAFGGVNLRMFHPAVRPENKKLKIIYSGDPRERKGTDIVERAIELIKVRYENEVEFASYWNKKFSQEQLVEFYQSGDIFLDAHRRAGWCNPVAEAIACGCPPVCTRIGANQDFAVHNSTALVVAVDDAVSMAAEAARLIEDPFLRQTLIRDGQQLIKLYSYEKVVPLLEKTLLRMIYDPI